MSSKNSSHPIDSQTVEQKESAESSADDFNQRGIYSCHYCGKDLFSSNYIISEDEGYLSFSESLCDLSLLKARIDEKIYQESYCSSCDTKLGFLFVDSKQVSRKRFFIAKISLVFRQYSLFGKNKAVNPYI